MSAGTFDRSAQQWYPNDDIWECANCEETTHDLDDFHQVYINIFLCDDCYQEHEEEQERLRALEEENCDEPTE